MKKRLSLIAATAILATSTVIQADEQLCLTPYVGADAQLRHMNFFARHGDNLLKHDSVQGNFYMGLRINDYIGIEGGYQSSHRRARTVAVGPGDSIGADTLLPAGISAQLNSTFKIKGPHFNVLGFIPVSDQHRLKLIALVGIANLKINVERQIIGRNNVQFSNRKNILRVGAGLEHMITEKWGIRASCILEGTSRLKATAPGRTESFNPKNSMIYSLGALFKF